MPIFIQLSSSCERVTGGDYFFQRQVGGGQTFIIWSLNKHKKLGKSAAGPLKFAR
jgi:hypothetical protein